ncbi:syntaxin-6 isoform X1 [Coccinella septempunctata]|uniref:syntaxin-6 isoform X1 n=2 Tax=Coccinella septempunctata TaxID=41139 RepID=UPI001D096E2E|nr:syntaxin-6 isoform X1 [Coccinella septempunctata]
MTLEDPFFVVKDEVFKALNKTRGLYLRWIEIQEDPICVSKEEIEWINTELKNSLRSIEWDLEDLEDTIDIVEKNPTKFKIDNKELTLRKKFIDSTREEVKLMRDKINMNRGRDRDHTARQPLLDTSEVKVTNTRGTTKYSKLENDTDSPQRNFIKDTFAQQQYLTRQQEEHLEAIGDSLGSLKNMSRHIGIELDEQAGMLDEFGTEMDTTESRMDSAMKRMAKVLHMTTDRRQWTAIIVLSIILFIVILLFIIL